MQPFTPEQKEIAKTFTPEEIENYNRLSSLGVAPTDSFNLVVSFREAPEKKGNNFLQDVFTTLIGKPAIRTSQAIGGVIVDAFGTPEQKARFDEDVRKPVELPLGLGTVDPVKDIGSGGLKQIAGEGLEAFSYLYGGGVGPKVAVNTLRGKVAESAINGLVTGAIGGGAFGAGEGLQDGKSAEEIILETIKGATIGGVAGGGLSTIATVIPPLVSATGRGTRKLRDMANEGIEKIKPSKNKVEQIVVDAQEAGIENINPVIAQEAVDRGFSDDVAVLLSSFDADDKKIAQELQRKAEKASVSKIAMLDRPVDVVGQNYVSKVNPLLSLLDQAGEELDDVVKVIKKKDLDTGSIGTQLTDFLKGQGIAKVDGKFTKESFANSRFQFVPSVQKYMLKVLNNIDDVAKSKNAFTAHNFKKSIDELVNYAKTSEGLTGEAEGVLQQIRGIVDGKLDSTYPIYNKANRKYGILKNFKDQNDKIFGKGKMDKQRAANAIGAVFSNQQKRGEIVRHIADTERLLKMFGIKSKGNIYKQFLFTEELKNLYGEPAITSLAGRVESAVGRTKQIVEGLRNPIEGIGKVAGDVVERVTGQTDEARKAFIKSLNEGKITPAGILALGGFGTAGALALGADGGPVEEEVVTQETIEAPKVVEIKERTDGTLIYVLESGIEVGEANPKVQEFIAGVYENNPELPKGVLETLLMKESSFGYDDTNRSKKKGMEYAWLGGLVKNAKKPGALNELDRLKIKYDVSTIPGALDAIAKFWITKQKDGETVYDTYKNEYSSGKLKESDLTKFDEMYKFYSNR